MKAKEITGAMVGAYLLNPPGDLVEDICFWKLWIFSLGPSSNVDETWMVDLPILPPNQRPLLDRPTSCSFVGASRSFAAWVFPPFYSLSSCSWI